MNILITIFTLLSVIFFFVLLSGELFVYRKNTDVSAKSDYLIQLAICLFLYLLSIVLLCAGAVVSNQFYFLFYSIFAICPFVIGKFSNYEHIKMYANIQILIVAAGIITGYLNLFVF